MGSNAGSSEIPRFDDAFCASLVARLTPYADGMAKAVLALEEAVTSGRSDPRVYEAALQMLARCGFWECVTAEAVGRHDNMTLAEACIATAAPDATSDRAERAYRTYAINILNLVWLIGEAVGQPSAAWPADLAAAILTALRTEPAVDPQVLADITDLAAGKQPATPTSSTAEKARTDEHAAADLAPEQARRYLTQFAPMVDRVLALVYRIRVAHEAGQREVGFYMPAITELCSVSLRLFINANAHRLVDPHGPDRLDQAVTAINAAARAHPEPDDTEELHQVAAMTLHVVWLAGRQQLIAPESWPPEIADIVLTTCRTTAKLRANE